MWFIKKEEEELTTWVPIKELQKYLRPPKR
jgi:hypothetical protein